VGEQGCLSFIALQENRSMRGQARFSLTQQDLRLRTRITDALVQDDKLIVLCADGSIRFASLFFKNQVVSSAAEDQAATATAPFLAHLLAKPVLREFPFRSDAISMASNDIDELLYMLTREGHVYKVPVPANAAAVDALLGQTMRT
jgi:hypothetical protein